MGGRRQNQNFDWKCRVVAGIAIRFYAFCLFLVAEKAIAELSGGGMSFVIVMPEIVATAATGLAGIGTTISAANAAAAAATTAVLPAGADEVSAAIAAEFGTHGQAYQAISAQTAVFH